MDTVHKREPGRHISASASARPNRAIGELGECSADPLRAEIAGCVSATSGVVGIQYTCNFSERRLFAFSIARSMDSYVGKKKGNENMGVG